MALAARLTTIHSCSSELLRALSDGYSESVSCACSGCCVDGATLVRSAPLQRASTVRVPPQADVRDVGTESSTRPPQRIPAPR